MALISPSLPFVIPFSIFVAANFSPQLPLFGFFSLKKKNCFRLSQLAREKEKEKDIERKKEREKKDVDLYLSISGDRSVRGLDLRLGCCRQKCGLVYRW